MASKTAQRASKTFVYGAADQNVDLLRHYDFRFFGIRHARKNAELKTVEDATWTDASAIMTGTLTVRDPSFGVSEQVRLEEGDQVLCQLDSGSGFRNYWLMRVKDPELQVSVGQRAVELANDLDLLARSTDDFKYTKDKGVHSRGWLGHQIIADVCKKWGVPLVQCPVMKTRMQVTPADGRGQRPVDVIQSVLQKERKRTGMRYRIRWDFIPGQGLRQGLYVTRLTRSPHLLSLGQTLIEARFKSSLPKEPPPSTNAFASALVMRGVHVMEHGKDKKGHPKDQHVHMRVYLESKPTIARYGYVRRVLWSGDAKTSADLLEEGRQYLAEIAKPVKTLEMTEVGMPFVRRGDAIRLGLGDAALQRQIVYVTSATHSLTPAEYRTTIEVMFDDPYVDKKAARIVDKLRASEGEAQQDSDAAKAAKASAKGSQRSDEGTTYYQSWETAGGAGG